MLLKSDANVGDVWLADSVNNDSLGFISAGMSSIGIGQITDSLKVFRFSVKDFNLTKSLGLIQFALFGAFKDY